MKLQGTLILTATFLVAPFTSHAASAPFGAASGYNLFAVGSSSTPGNITTTADINGRVAAAGSTTATTVMSNLNGDPWGAGITWAVVAGTSIGNGGSYNVNDHGVHGDVYAPAGTAGINFNNSGDGMKITSGGYGFSFDDLRIALDNQTAFLGALSTTGTVVGLDRSGANASLFQNVNPSNFILYGTDPSLNVFTLSAADFAAMGSNHQLDVHVPNGSTVIINILGTNVTIGSGGAFLYNGHQYSDNDTSTDRILFNIPNATTVNIVNALSASVLAPYATLTSSSQIDGNFIAAAIGSTGEVHNVEFIGNLPVPPVTPPPTTPAVPEPGTLLLAGTGLLSVAGIVRHKRNKLA